MPSLRDLQDSFARAMFNPGHNAIEACIATGGMAAADRLAIYRNNLRHNYVEALRAVFPVIERLVGEQFFRHAALAYVPAYRSRQGNLHAYGEHLGEFLAGFGPAAGLSYLADVARLEWHVHEAFHAAEVACFDSSRLGTVLPEYYPALRFILHPACRLIASPFPIERIWAANQDGADGAVDLAAGACQVLVRRPCEDIVVESVGAAEYAMLKAFQAGLGLDLALSAARAQDAGFDLAGFVARRAEDGTFGGFDFVGL